MECDTRMITGSAQVYQAAQYTQGRLSTEGKQDAVLSSPSPKPQPKANKVTKRIKEKGIWTKGLH